MKENDTNTENKLLLNKFDTEETNNIQTTKPNLNESPKKDDYIKYLKAFIIKEMDIKNFIEKLNNLKCCLNQFLDSIMDNPSLISQLLEIRRKNITINMYKIIDTHIVCKWCGENCLKYAHRKNIDINFSKINNKFCSCANENHALIFKEKLSLNSEDIEIDKICDIHFDKSKDDNEKVVLIKKEILNLLKEKENRRILLIISYILNLDFLNIYLINNDDIYKIILSCLKENKEYSQFNNVMYFYFQHLISEIKKDEAPIFIFNELYDKKSTIPALCYYEPDAFSQSFFFQVYRKIIVSKSFENKNIFLFLRKNGISNDILCSHLMNYYLNPVEIYSFGFLSLDSILNNTNIELSKFKQNINDNIIYILINQFCDIFSDFMNFGKTNRDSLVDPNSNFSKLFYEKIIQFISKNFNDFVSFKIIKKILIHFPLFKLSFNDENKERILIVLSTYSYSLAQKENVFNEFEFDSKIFEKIEKDIKKIVNEKKFKKYNSEQNLIIVKKLLDLYNLKYNNYSIEDLNSFDFNSLIQNLIEKDYPIKLLEKVLKIINNLNNENKKDLNIYFEYILKIMLLFCTNIFGGAYIYNSNFISKILIIIKKIDFNEYSNFILEIIFILKISFNRKIIDLSFLTMTNNENLITLKEYLFYILFINEPIIKKDSFYFFRNFDKLLKRIKSNYKFIFNKTNNIFINSFKNINFDESYLNIIKILVLNNKEEFSNLKWENDIKEEQIFEEFLEKNEEFIEKKINEESEKIKDKIPAFILIDILRCLENLNQTNFYLNFEKDSFFINTKYNIASIIINENLPFAIKSLLLNFLLKLVLTQKIDAENNKIFGPLLYTTEFENNVEQHSIDEKNLITFESKESEKHLNETIKLMNIFIICIEMLKKKDFKKAFIEKNGLYDFGVSIIHAINCFCNLIINTNKIHDLYLMNFTKLLFKFFENENFFMEIINIKIKHNNFMLQLKKNFNYEEQMENIFEIHKIIQIYI